MPGTRRQPRRMLPAAVLVIVLGAGLAVALAARHGTGAAAAGALRRDGRHRLRPARRERARRSCRTWTWPGCGGAAITASSCRPRRRRDRATPAAAWPSGFADTPLGALLAAVNIGVRANAQWGPAIFGPTIRGQVTGPDAAVLLASCQSGYDQASQAAHISGGQPLGDAYVAEEAFRWVAYTPSDATVDLVSAGPGSQGTTVRATTRIEVVWAGGDWRVVAPPGGDWGNSAAQLTSLGGYTIFPGQG